MSQLIVPANCTLVAAPAPLLSGAAAPPSLDAAPREFVASENIMKDGKECFGVHSKEASKRQKTLKEPTQREERA